MGALFLVREPSIGPFIPRPDCPSRLILRIGIGKSASHSIHAAGIEEKRGGESEIGTESEGRRRNWSRFGFKVSVPIHLCGRALARGWRSPSSLFMLISFQAIQPSCEVPQWLVACPWNRWLVSRRNTVTT